MQKTGTSHFAQLAADLHHLKADELNKAAEAPGLTAHQVAVLEAQRNRIASQAAAMRRGEQ